jgi:hypothetical protein
MAKRVQVERLRPKTQNDVFVRPVNTYVTPAADQETSLMKLSKTVERLVPELDRKLQGYEREKRKKWEDESRDEAARAAAKGIYDTNEAVKAGLISPDASPVAHYKLNELHGEQLGFEFSSWLTNEYLTDPIRTQTDPSQYRDWYLSKHAEFSEMNADVLAKEGASTSFLTVSDSVFNSGFNTHKQASTKNFIAETESRFTTSVMNTASRYDLTTEEGLTAFGLDIEANRQDLYETAGMGFRQTGEMALDALIAHYSATNDYEGLSKAASQLRGGTGALITTSYAKTKLAEAKLAFTKAELTQQKQEEEIFKINQSRTVDKFGYEVNQRIASGILDAEQIEKEIREKNPELLKELDIYDPDWRTTLMEDIEKNKGLTLNETMYVTDLVPLRQELESLPPSQRVARVNQMARDKRITDKAVYEKLYSWAESSESPDARTDATKDSVFKQFNENVYKKMTDKYLGTAQADRLNEFIVMYYDKFDEVDPETGSSVWQSMTFSEKRNWLHSTMMDVMNAPTVPVVDAPAASPVNNGAENPLATETTETPKAPENPMVPDNTNVTPSGRTFVPVEPVEPEVKPEPKPQIDYRENPELMKGYPFPAGSNVEITGEDLVNFLREMTGLKLKPTDTAFLQGDYDEEEMAEQIKEYLDAINQADVTIDDGATDEENLSTIPLSP